MEAQPNRRGTDAKLDELVSKFDAFVTTSESYRRGQQRDIKCLHDSFEQFRDKYSPMLEATIAEKTFWKGVREEATKKTVTATVWVVLAAVAVALWHEVSAALRGQR